MIDKPKAKKQEQQKKKQALLDKHKNNRLIDECEKILAGLNKNNLKTISETTLLESVDKFIDTEDSITELINWFQEKGIQIIDDEDEANSRIESMVNSDTYTEDSVKLYLREIGKHARLTVDEEISLSIRVQEGLKAEEKLNAEWEKVEEEKIKSLDDQEFTNEWLKNRELAKIKDEWMNENYPEEYKILQDGVDARNHFVEANLRLVVAFAKKFIGRGMTFLDLIQEGSIGLIKAAEKFDHSKGFKFSTYATWWIRQSISRSIADQSRTIRVPVHMVETINKMNKIYRQLLQSKDGVEPTDSEIAKEMGVTPQKIAEIKQISLEPISLETPIGEEEDSHLGDFIEDVNTIAPDAEVDNEIMMQQIVEALKTLSPRENEVIRMRYGFDDGKPKTLEEVGKQFNVTRERIRQIESKAMRQLKKKNLNFNK